MRENSSEYDKPVYEAMAADGSKSNWSGKRIRSGDCYQQNVPATDKSLTGYRHARENGNMMLRWNEVKKYIASRLDDFRKHINRKMTYLNVDGVDIDEYSFRKLLIQDETLNYSEMDPDSQQQYDRILHDFFSRYTISLRKDEICRMPSIVTVVHRSLQLPTDGFAIVPANKLKQLPKISTPEFISGFLERDEVGVSHQVVDHPVVGTINDCFPIDGITHDVRGCNSNEQEATITGTLADNLRLKGFDKIEAAEFERFSKNTVFEEIRTAHNPLTERIMRMISTVVDCSSGVDELEFRDSSTTVQLLQMLCSNAVGKSQIRQLSITSENDISEIISTMCRIMKDRTTESLNLSENNLTDDSVSSLKKSLTRTPVPSLKALDISNNEEISDYATLAKLININRMPELRMCNCGIVPEWLTQLKYHLSEKLARLDLSYNAELSADCCTCIGYLLKKDADYLGLSECDITETEALALFRSLSEQQIKLNALDLSYNGDLRYSGVSVISKFVAKCELSELSLAGCNLDVDCIVTLRKNLVGRRLKKLDLSDNSPMHDKSVENLGQMVAGCPVENLDLSNCALSSNQIEKFSDSLGNSKIYRLNISDDQLMLDRSMIEAIARVTLKVADELTVSYENIVECLPSLLDMREHIGDAGVRIACGYTDDHYEIRGVSFLPKGRIK